MLLLDAVIVLAVAGVVIYAILSIAMSRPNRPQITSAAGARWRTAHYEAADATRVVVQRVLPDDVTVLDEHLIATLERDDPAYDAAFLEAMARARQRVALFESEES